MAAPGKPISHELKTTSPPEEVIRDLVVQADGLDRLGYKIEQHTATMAVLARRYTPTIAGAVPLGIAAFFFLLGTAGPSATVETAETAGSVARLCLIAAFVLWLVVKSTDRVTFSASADDDAGGSRVSISGTATPALRDYILARRFEVPPRRGPATIATDARKKGES